MIMDGWQTQNYLNSLQFEAALKPTKIAYKWTPITEMLPKSDKEVLISIGTGKGSYVDIASRYERQKMWVGSSNYYDYDKEVTAWMPLPEPYGE